MDRVYDVTIREVREKTVAAVSYTHLDVYKRQVYGLPEGTYILHEELPPYVEGYVSAEDIEFEVKEDGSVTKVAVSYTHLDQVKSIYLGDVLTWDEIAE